MQFKIWIFFFFEELISTWCCEVLNIPTHGRTWRNFSVCKLSLYKYTLCTRCFPLPQGCLKGVNQQHRLFLRKCLQICSLLRTGKQSLRDDKAASANPKCHYSHPWRINVSHNENRMRRIHYTSTTFIPTAPNAHWIHVYLKPYMFSDLRTLTKHLVDFKIKTDRQKVSAVKHERKAAVVWRCMWWSERGFPCHAGKSCAQSVESLTFRARCQNQHGSLILNWAIGRSVSHHPLCRGVDMGPHSQDCSFEHSCWSLFLLVNIWFSPQTPALTLHTSFCSHTHWVYLSWVCFMKNDAHSFTCSMVYSASVHVFKWLSIDKKTRTLTSGNVWQVRLPTDRNVKAIK